MRCCSAGSAATQAGGALRLRRLAGQRKRGCRPGSRRSPRRRCRRRTGLPVCALLAGRCARATASSRTSRATRSGSSNGGPRGRGRCLPRGATGGRRPNGGWSTTRRTTCPPEPAVSGELRRRRRRRPRRSHVNDFGGQRDHLYPFENLEALELDRCRHVDGLMLDGR